MADQTPGTTRRDMMLGIGALGVAGMVPGPVVAALSQTSDIDLLCSKLSYPANYIRFLTHDLNRCFVDQVPHMVSLYPWAMALNADFLAKAPVSKITAGQLAVLNRSQIKNIVGFTQLTKQHTKPGVPDEGNGTHVWCNLILDACKSMLDRTIEAMDEIQPGGDWWDRIPRVVRFSDELEAADAEFGATWADIEQSSKRQRRKKLKKLFATMRPITASL